MRYSVLAFVAIEKAMAQWREFRPLLMLNEFLVDNSRNSEFSEKFPPISLILIPPNGNSA